MAGGKRGGRGGVLYRVNMGNAGRQEGIIDPALRNHPFLFFLNVLEEALRRLEGGEGREGDVCGFGGGAFDQIGRGGGGIGYRFEEGLKKIHIN